jgi:hypothetical protein
MAKTSKRSRYDALLCPPKQCKELIFRQLFQGVSNALFAVATHADNVGSARFRASIMLTRSPPMLGAPVRVIRAIFRFQARSFTRARLFAAPACAIGTQPKSLATH